MRRMAMTVLLILVAALTGCGGATETAATPEPVPSALLQAIASGEQSGVGMVPITGMAVKSKDFENIYFVAMKFSATGVEDQVGVWATNSLEVGNGLIYSVDGTAKAFTTWGDGSKTDAKMSMSDDGAEEAKAALK